MPSSAPSETLQLAETWPEECASGLALSQCPHVETSSPLACFSLGFCQTVTSSLPDVRRHPPAPPGYRDHDGRPPQPALPSSQVPSALHHAGALALSTHSLQACVSIPTDTAMIKVMGGPQWPYPLDSLIQSTRFCFVSPLNQALFQAHRYRGAKAFLEFTFQWNPFSS